MTKKKAQSGKQTTQEQLEDLAELAASLNVPDDAFEGDLRDAADMEADKLFDGIKDAVLLDKLEFLWLSGYQLGRLRELIEEYAQQS